MCSNLTFSTFSKYQRQHLPFYSCCKTSSFSLYFEILFAFFTNMRSSIYLLSHAAPKHGFKSWKSPQRHLVYCWKWHLTKSFFLRGEVGNFQRFPVSVFVHKHSLLIFNPHKNVPHLFTTSVKWFQQIYLALMASLYHLILHFWGTFRSSRVNYYFRTNSNKVTVVGNWRVLGCHIENR